MDWQPIETAPKDETFVLAWEPRASKPYVAQWDGGQWWTDDDQYNDYAHSYPPTCEPTHWLPLPSSPA